MGQFLSLRTYSFPLFAGMLASVAIAVSPARADQASATATLEAKGIQVKASGLSLEKENELRAALKEVTNHRKELLKATRELARVQGAYDQVRAQITQLQQKKVEYSTQLAQVNATDPNNVALNNQLVGALNALDAQQSLLAQQEQKGEEELGAARRGWSDAREDYLQLVLDMRTIVNDIESQFEALAKDPEAQAAVTELNEAMNKEFTLEPSRAFAASVKRLESLEKDVLSESITLRRERNTLYVPVRINGKYSHEMVIDSGASLICLPSEVATKLGVSPTDDDPTVNLVMADGREIEGKLITLDEVRVGKFTVKNVEAAVLGPDAIHAESLLGMSFLGSFKFELDAKAGTLNMVDIEEANPDGEAAKSKPGRSRRKAG